MALYVVQITPKKKISPVLEVERPLGKQALLAIVIDLEEVKTRVLRASVKSPPESVFTFWCTFGPRRPLRKNMYHLVPRGPAFVSKPMERTVPLSRVNAK